MPSPDSLPTFIVPKRTDHNGEHPRFHPKMVLMRMIFIRKELMDLWALSQKRGTSIESTFEWATSLYRDVWSNQREGGKVIIYKKDGSMQEIRLKE